MDDSPKHRLLLCGFFFVVIRQSVQHSFYFTRQFTNEGSRTHEEQSQIETVTGPVALCLYDSPKHCLLVVVVVVVVEE